MRDVCNIAVRGKRNTGKSYLIEKVIAEISGKVWIAGFFTKKLISGEVTLRAWDDFLLFDNGPQATVYDERDGCIRKEGFNELGVWAIERAIAEAGFIVMDELGRFEINCDNFIQAVHRAFDCDIPVLCSMKSEENAFLDSLTSRNDISVFMITESNRNGVYNSVISKIKKMIEI